MSGVVSYDLLTEKFGIGNIGFTPEGGMYELFINNTGVSVKGTIVIASTSIDNAVDIAPANSNFPIGVIYETGINNGAFVKVVVYGKAEVLLKNGESSTNGYWCGVSNVDGRMYQLSSLLLDLDHNKEIGHSLQSKSDGTNVLSLIQMHFN